MEELAMKDKVSESVTGQNLPKPTREERDQAFSTGAGRKAVEVPVPEEFQRKSEEDPGSVMTAPVGTELETQARELDDDL
jgi:hypothetical protein